MTITLKNVSPDHLKLLQEMANTLKFEIVEPGAASSDSLSADSEENAMTLFSMQASSKSFAELWDREEDAYWNAYL